MKILFVTGKLAERALRETLAGMETEFEYEVAVLTLHPSFPLLSEMRSGHDPWAVPR